jgi:hypothetical protein
MLKGRDVDPLTEYFLSQENPNSSKRIKFECKWFPLVMEKVTRILCKKEFNDSSFSEYFETEVVLDESHVTVLLKCADVYSVSEHNRHSTLVLTRSGALRL